MPVTIGLTALGVLQTDSFPLSSTTSQHQPEPNCETPALINAASNLVTLPKSLIKSFSSEPGIEPPQMASSNPKILSGSNVGQRY